MLVAPTIILTANAAFRAEREASYTTKNEITPPNIHAPGKRNGSPRTAPPPHTCQELPHEHSPYTGCAAASNRSVEPAKLCNQPARLFAYLEEVGVTDGPHNHRHHVPQPERYLLPPSGKQHQQTGSSQREARTNTGREAPPHTYANAPGPTGTAFRARAITSTLRVER